MDNASYRLTGFDKDWTLDVKKNKYKNLLCLFGSYQINKSVMDGKAVQ